MSSKPKSFHITVIPQIDKTTDLKYALEEVKNIKTIQTPFTCKKKEYIKQVHEILQENGKNIISEVTSEDRKVMQFFDVVVATNESRQTSSNNLMK